MIELWAKIPRHQDYEISSLGHVRRATPGCNTFAGRDKRTHITQSRNGRRRRVVHLPYACKRRLKTYKVAALILEAFIGSRPSKRYLASHLNDKELDDRLVNLAWETHAMNVRRRQINRELNQ